MKVAIFGAGTMGRGIAQVFAANGHTALMYASSMASAARIMYFCSSIKLLPTPWRSR